MSQSDVRKVESHSKRVGKLSNKQADLHKINKQKQKLLEILANNTDYSLAVKVSKTTKFISKLLNTTLKYQEECQNEGKPTGTGPVSVDRKLKLVEWACQTAMNYIRETCLPQLEAEVKSAAERELATRELNRVSGDICRYMSICKGVHRNGGALSAKARFICDFWAATAIEYYDHSNLTLAEYDVRIKHLFNGSPQRLLIALLFDLRKLSEVSTVERSKRLPPGENRTIFAEERSHALREVAGATNNVLLQGFSVCAAETINYVKNKDAGIRLSNSVFQKKLGMLRKQWDTIPIVVSSKDTAARDSDVDCVIFGLVMLADLVKHGLDETLLVSFSIMIKTAPLHERVQRIINPDTKVEWPSPILEYFYSHTQLDGESFMKKVQKLNSRPAYF